MRCPEDWPGASSTQALLTGRPVSGVWFDRTLEFEANRCGKIFSKYEFAEALEFALVPLPTWRHLSASERRERICQIVREIAAETRQRIRKEGPALGVRRILRQNPHSKPSHSERSPKPHVHDVDPAVRRSIKIAFFVFRLAYKKASQELRAGRLDVDFPAGAHRPRLPFARGQPGFA